MADHAASAAIALRNATEQADQIFSSVARSRAYLRIALAYAQLAAIAEGLPPAPLPVEASDEKR